MTTPHAPAAPGLRAAGRAAPERTLVDVFGATVARFPEAPAIDDGDEVLTYAALAEAVGVRARRLAEAGVRPGDRVGVRAASGTVGLYVSVLAVLHAGAAYVPVDADDPDERADRVFAEAGVVAILGDGPEPVRLDTAPRSTPDGAVVRPPRPDDDAWIIFTSGSTGRPKGVAVTHRSAAAFVDAEARLFLTGAPIGPGDRVLAGLSVAFDASCEEMWLAWRHGAVLVPAPRALVRAGSELGPWLVDREITVVSTVPTLAGLWPAESLDAVRLLIFGGEAVPPELAARLWSPRRELWNTYGPTEATVVACAALLEPEQPVRIGLPLDGWDLAVVDADGREVGDGGTGQLVIGGVGLARYLDGALDAASFAPMPTLGWTRAYRTGDLVTRDPAGLLFVGRADDQVKVNGHRIELAEVDAALQALPGVVAAASAVRRAAAGGTVLVGYLVVADPDDVDLHEQLQRLREQLPGSMVPLLAVVDEIPTRTSGKVDRDALPWPLAALEDEHDTTSLTGVAAWVGTQWAAVIGLRPQHEDDDFFTHGGSSLTAAQLVSALRSRYPEVTVAEVYDHPAVGDLARHLERTWPDRQDRDDAADDAVRAAQPVPVGSQALQLVALLPLRGLLAQRWLTVLAAVNAVLRTVWDVPWAAPVSWWWVAAGWLVTVSPLGRLGVCAAAVRALLAGVGPGRYPRGGHVHLRLWAAERLVDGFGAVTPSSAPWVTTYARALGADIGDDVDLHSVPPVTGLLTLGAGSAIEPEVDLSGHWVDGDVLHIGRVSIGAGATVGARSVLLPGAQVGAGTDVAAGSAVHGRTGTHEYWSGSPATRQHEARHPWPAKRPRTGRVRVWAFAYACAGAAVAALPTLAALPAVAILGAALRGTPSLTAAVGPAVVASLVAVPAAYLTYAVLTVLSVRALGRRLPEGYHPVRSGAGVRAWTTERLMDAARTALFPLYSSSLTPAWLRLLGAQVGRATEISTVVGLPTMMRIRDGAFLADDTMVAPYELGGGWLRVAAAKVGRRAFLGNSGMTAPGRTVPKNGLVAVLSATPNRTRAGSSYIGSPPVLLARAPSVDDGARTYESTRALRWARGAVEACRVLPVLLLGALWTGAGLALQGFVATGGWTLAAVAGGPVLVLAGVVGAIATVVAKWLLVGRFRAGEHPLWSSAVWRSELADTFTEVVAAPLFADAVAGTVALVWWLRGLGAHIGRGVWCETYWLPEADLVRLGDGATVGPGCVVQTHLFHDRVMSLDTVTVGAGATLGSHGVILPAAALAAGATVGPASLVLRGETVPAGTRWVGNPIAPWRATEAAA